MSSNDYANRLSSQPPLSRHLPVPRERPINGGSTVEVSPDFAFCMTIIRDFSKPCLTKNVVFYVKRNVLADTLWKQFRTPWNLAMHAGRLVSCIFTSRHRSGLLLGGSRLLKSTELLSPSLFLFFSFLKAGD